MNIKNSIQTFLSILLVSLTFILGKTLEHVSSPSLLSFLRFATSSLCFLPFVNYVSLRAISLKNFILMAIASLFGIVAFNVFFFSAVKYTSAINIALLNALVPLLTVITSIFIKKTFPSFKTIFLFLLSFAGLMLLITKGDISILFAQSFKGEFLMLLGSISWVIYGYIIERIKSRCSMIDITFVIGLIGSLILALITYFSGSLTLHAFSAITTYEWIAIMCIGAFGTSLSFFFYNTIIQTLSPNKANLLVFTLSPVVVALYAVVVEKQTLNSWQLLGIICILASIVPPFISKGKKL